MGAVGYLIGVLGIVWALNLFNFMDGIDASPHPRRCSSQVPGRCCRPVAGWCHGCRGRVCLRVRGLLIWNWPPAKIFLGDVGSGYLGYLIAVLALAATRENPLRSGHG